MRGSTNLTAVTSQQSNVPYQIRVYYNVTKRTAAEVTLDLDVQVHYPKWWSSNGAWVKLFDGNNEAVQAGSWVEIIGTRYATGELIPDWVKAKRHQVTRVDGSRVLLGGQGGINSYVNISDLRGSGTIAKSLNPSHVWDKHDWFASGGNSRADNAYWVRGKTFKVNNNSTSVNIRIGFSNQYWAEGEYHIQTISVPIQAYSGSTSNADKVGDTNAIKLETVAVTVPEYFSKDINVTWTKSAFADTFILRIEKWIGGEWITERTIPDIKDTKYKYVPTSLQNGDRYRVQVRPLYKNSNLVRWFASKGTRKNYPLDLPVVDGDVPSHLRSSDTFSLKPVQNEGVFRVIRYRLRLSDTSNNVLLTTPWQMLHRFSGIFKQYNGKVLLFEWQATDGIEDTAWSTPIQIRIGYQFSINEVMTNKTLFEPGLVVDSPPPKADGELLSNVDYSFNLQYRIKHNGTYNTWRNFDTVRVPRSLSAAGFTRTDAWDLIIAEMPELIRDETRKNDIIEIRATALLEGLEVISNTITLQNSVPNIVTSLSSNIPVAYSMDKLEPNSPEILNIEVKGVDLNSQTVGSVSVYLIDNGTGQSTTITTFSISGASFTKNISINLDVYGCRPGNRYQIKTITSVNSPKKYVQEQTGIWSNGANAFTVPEEIAVDLTINSARTDLIDNDIAENAFSTTYTLSWYRPKAYAIVSGQLTISYYSEGVTHAAQFSLPTSETLFDNTISNRNFGAHITLSDIQLGDKWEVVDGYVIKASQTQTDQSLTLIENDTDILVTLELELAELYRSSSTEQVPNASLISANRKILKEEFLCNTIEEPYYSSAEGFTVRRL